MTVEEMKRRKREKGYTYAQISELSGVPLGTVQKIFSGETSSPRYDTLQALESIFEEGNEIQEKSVYGVRGQGTYTIDDYRALPEDVRVELIDGYFFEMLAPTPLHQKIAGEVYRQIANFIMDNDGDCQPLIAPIDIQLDCDERTMVQPDVAILCRNDKLRRWGIYGAPDFVLEVVSPSTKKKDYTQKLHKYMSAGVREYWILDPSKKILIVYEFEKEECPMIYGLANPVPIGIFGDRLNISFEHIVKWIDQELAE